MTECVFNHFVHSNKALLFKINLMCSIISNIHFPGRWGTVFISWYKMSVLTKLHLPLIWSISKWIIMHYNALAFGLKLRHKSTIDSWRLTSSFFFHLTSWLYSLLWSWKVWCWKYAHKCLLYTVDYVCVETWMIASTCSKYLQHI